MSLNAAKFISLGTRAGVQQKLILVKPEKPVASVILFACGEGVPAKNNTVSGFSKGSIITLAAAGLINNSNINYVLPAGCSEELNDKYNVDASKAGRRILSIYDSGDEQFESCEDTIKPSTKIKFEETDLDSGKKHKVFRIPNKKFIEQWHAPLIECIS